jgi:hypothetical protein
MDFTLDEALALMPEVLAHADETVRLRADLAELALDLRTGGVSPLGGMPEQKAFEALLNEELTWFSEQGLEIKGFAPLLLDFPSELDGQSVQLCWLEGDRELGWYHRSELGFAGRRRLILKNS